MNPMLAAGVTQAATEGVKEHGGSMLRLPATGLLILFTIIVISVGMGNLKNNMLLGLVQLGVGAGVAYYAHNFLNAGKR